MKISKKALVLMAVMIPAVLLGGLGMNRSQQFEEQRQLRQELSLAKQRLANLQAERLASSEKGLEKELNDTLAQLSDAKSALSPFVSSISVTDKLFQIADSCGVVIIRMDSAGLSSQKLNSIKCSVISLTAVAEGDLPDLIDFVKTLNTEHLTGVVESAQIDLIKQQTGGKPNVKVQFIIYTYQGGKSNG